VKTPRNPYLLPLVGVLAAALLFTLIALLAPADWGASSPGPAVVPGVEVDVDVHHPRARHSPQASTAPAKQRRVATPAPLVKSTPPRK